QRTVFSRQGDLRRGLHETAGARAGCAGDHEQSRPSPRGDANYVGGVACLRRGGCRSLGGLIQRAAEARCFGAFGPSAETLRSGSAGQHQHAEIYGHVAGSFWRAVEIPDGLRWARRYEPRRAVAAGRREWERARICAGAWRGAERKTSGTIGADRPDAARALQQSHAVAGFRRKALLIMTHSRMFSSVIMPTKWPSRTTGTVEQFSVRSIS